MNGLYLSLSAADRGTLPPLWLLKQNYVAQNYIKYMKRCHVSLSFSVVTLMAATIPMFIHGLFTTNAALTAQGTMNNPKSGTKLWHILLTLNNVTDRYLCIFMESCHTDAKFQAIKSLWPYCDDIKCATGHTIKLHASHLCCITVLSKAVTRPEWQIIWADLSPLWKVNGKCMRMHQLRYGLCFNVFLMSRTTTWAHKCWTICIWFAAIIWYLEQTKHTKPSRLKPHVHVNAQVHRIISAILLYWILERTSAVHLIRGYSVDYTMTWGWTLSNKFTKQ